MDSVSLFYPIFLMWKTSIIKTQQPKVAHIYHTHMLLILSCESSPVSLLIWIHSVAENQCLSAGFTSWARFTLFSIEGIEF